MIRITLCSMFLIWLMTAVHCKKYLVEVDDDNSENSPDNAEVGGDVEEDWVGSTYDGSIWRRGGNEDKGKKMGITRKLMN